MRFIDVIGFSGGKGGGGGEGGGEVCRCCREEEEEEEEKGEGRVWLTRSRISWAIRSPWFTMIGWMLLRVFFFLKGGDWG